MPLPLPRLDDRDFDQLVEEVRESLPARAPEWTDHNASDPGITLVELFAYLTEIGLYRLDRVSDATRRTWLRLLGAGIDPARAAVTVVALRQTAVASMRVRAGLQLANADDTTAFQTTARVDVLRAQLTTVLAEHDGQITDVTSSASGPGSIVQPFGRRPLHGDAVYLGFDRRLAPEGRFLRLFFFGDSLAHDFETWRALAADARERRRANREACGARARHAVPFWRHYGARLAWEYFDDTGAWRAVPHVRDRTRALTISGPVVIRVPKPATQGAGGVSGFPATYFIRARFSGGEYDCAPRLRGVRINTTLARHAIDRGAPEPLPPSFGRAGMTARLDARPVVPGTSRVVVTPAGGGAPEAWTEVLDWDRSGPFDSHYRLDPASGTVAFGNGRYGRVPPAGASLSAQYKTGGGPDGNVPAGTLTRLRAIGPNLALPNWTTIEARVTLQHPAPAVGGARAMTLDEGEGRAVRLLDSARAAVTPADMVRVARGVAGVPVARAFALPGVHPVSSCFTAHGCVTVVVITPCVDDRPHPTEALLREVAAALDRRRPAATEIHVVGPRFTTVIVRARLALSGRGSRSTTPDTARAALDTFFHPLHGGSDGQGWPVGRSVYRSEVLALLAGLPDVDHVTDLDITTCARGAGRCGNVDICADGLVRSGAHQIVID